MIHGVDPQQIEERLGIGFESTTPAFLLDTLQNRNILGIGRRRIAHY
jgi:hypothetical protein